MSDTERVEEMQERQGPWTLIGQVARAAGLLTLMLLACGMLFVVLVGFVLPTRVGLWDQAKLTSCKNNLKSIGVGLKIYAASNRNGLFPSPYSKAGEDRAAKERWGGPDAWDEKTFQLKDRGKEGMKLEDHDPFTCNLSCLWMLVRDGSLTSGVLICPSDQGAVERKTATPRDWWSIESLPQCSYSYQNQLGRTTRDNVSPDVVLAADKSPMRPDVQTPEKVKAGRSKPAPDSDPAKWYTWNSPNHGWKGQNALYGDGHIEYVESPKCGKDGNNIWIGEDWDVDNKVWKPTDQPVYGRYDKAVTHKYDSWLVP